MVDIIKIPSNRPFFEQITVPILSRNDRSNNKQWIGRCPGDQPRQFNISDLPNLQRNVINREMLRCYSINFDRSMKIKQQQKTNNREPLKVTTVTSNSILSNIDETDSRLFEALSKHFTIKPEPLRPVVNNNIVNNSNNIQSSWQKYWTSTNPQRGRKEINDFQLPFVRPKRDQSGLTTPHFVTTRDSSAHFTTESSTPVLSDNSMNSSKSSSPPIESECTDEINTLTSKIYQFPLPSNHPQPTKSILKKRSKSLERKPIVSTTIIEKKEIKSVSPPVSNIIPISKRKNSILSNKSHRSLTKKQQQSLATVITTTPRSKYGPNKWDEPYIGPRFDPPTPPSSPSYFPWSQINDQNENETLYKLNFIDEIYF